ncbi:MAG: Gfo/Idh/MocA family oxidoreductase [Planctomycetota bacterium]
MNPIRLIQAGVGGHGGGWLRNTTHPSPAVDLVAIVDPNPEAVAAAREVTGLPADRCFDDLGKALAEVDADAVLSAAPPAFHRAQAETVFAAGRHLLVEKPIAESIEDARAMVDAADAAGKTLMVAQNYRWKPPVRTLKRVFADAPLGTFGHGHLDFFIPGDFTGTFRETMPHVLLVDMAVHHLDLIRHVTGRNITRVYAESFNPSWSWYQGEAALVMLLHLDDGTRFTYHGDWAAKGYVSSWDGEWRLQCADGCLRFGRKTDEHVLLERSELWQAGETTESIAPADAPNAQMATLDHFVESIRNNTEPMTSGRDNLQTFATVIAARRSAETGTPVNVADVLG